jgi:hypothetical protein
MNAPAGLESARNALAVIDQITGPRDPKTGAYSKPHAGMGRVVGTPLQLFPSMPGGEAANFEALMEQVKGGTFLRAFESLKGGGAITNVEGEKATAAIARLNTKQSVPEFMKSVNELRDIIQRGAQRLETINRGGAPAPASAPAAKPPADAVMQQARDALAKGAPREAVIKRLQENGYPTDGF